MSADLEEIRNRLADLGARIEAKVQELRQQGVLHGAARQKAAELQIEHARILNAANAQPRGLRGIIATELATDTEILSHAFERWVAEVDARSERR